MLRLVHANKAKCCYRVPYEWPNKNGVLSEYVCSWLYGGYGYLTRYLLDFTSWTTNPRLIDAELSNFCSFTVAKLIKFNND